MSTKICTKCDLEQDIDNFYVCKKGSNKRVSDCKECQSKAKARKIKHVPDLDGEIWMPFIGLEDICVVSNKGRFRRIFQRKNPTNKLLKPFIHDDGDGYAQITVCYLGKHISHLAHRVVAMAFILNPNNLPEVNHKDGNKSNNCVENLEWCTSAENVKEAYRLGLAKPKQGELHGNSKLTEKEVLEIRAIGKTMSQKEIGKLYGINHQAVYKILKRIRWTHI